MKFSTAEITFGKGCTIWFTDIVPEELNNEAYKK